MRKAVPHLRRSAEDTTVPVAEGLSQLLCNVSPVFLEEIAVTGSWKQGVVAHTLSQQINIGIVGVVCGELKIQC